MCGRYKFTRKEEIARYLDIEAEELENARTDNDDVRPIVLMPVVSNLEPRTLVGMRWGLIPSWAKKEGGKFPTWLNSTFNARSEEAAEKPAFRTAFKANRCLVPCDGFYEWTGEKGSKLKHYISLQSGDPMVFAGLWDKWRGPEGEVLSFTILTCEPNHFMSGIHNRMPVILAKPDFDRWLQGTPAEVKELMVPCPDSWLEEKAVV
jgi:putative SOS response-associated peptidase YedK